MNTTTPPASLAPAVTLLDRAARECAARGDTATSGLDDQTIWHLDAQRVRLTAETLRSATPTALPEPDDVHPTPADDPLALVQSAHDELAKVPDDPDNQPLCLARIRLADALSAVRTHHE
jgi:hypothetical protein